MNEKVILKIGMDILEGVVAAKTRYPGSNAVRFLIKFPSFEPDEIRLFGAPPKMTMKQAVADLDIIVDYRDVV